MVCPKCKSGALSTVPAEIRLYRNGPRTMSHPPFSPQPDVQICLDCGNAEFVIPEKWLSAGWLQGHKKAPVSVAAPTLITEVRRHIA
jgi:hypothetical protein